MNIVDDLEEGDDVRITYTSQRSGNEIAAEGPVTAAFTHEAGHEVVHVHRDQQTPLKHSYVVLVPATLESGEAVVAAHSITCEATVPDRPRIGSSHTATFENVRQSVLGVVESCWKKSSIAIERGTCLIDREGLDE